MAGFDYGRSAAQANRMIARFGQPAVLERPTKSGPAYNPTIGTPGEHAVTVVVTGYDAKDIDGTRILATDKKVLLAKGNMTITPTLSDLLKIGGEPHRIIDIRTLAPGGQVVLWTLQCRR